MPLIAVPSVVFTSLALLSVATLSVALSPSLIVTAEPDAAATLMVTSAKTFKLAFCASVAELTAAPLVLMSVSVTSMIPLPFRSGPTAAGSKSRTSS